MNSNIIQLENKLYEYRLELLQIKLNADSKRQDQILESIKKLKNKIALIKKEEEELDEIPNSKIIRNKTHTKYNIKKGAHSKKDNQRNKVFYSINKILCRTQHLLLIMFYR